MIENGFPCGSAPSERKGLPDYTYTGQAQTVDDGDGNWRIKFLTSGAFTLLSPASLNVDVFLVGGGGAGGGGNSATQGDAGGGGGYTLTGVAAITIGQPVEITIGSGGMKTADANGPNGGASRFGSLEAQGGSGGAQGMAAGKGGDGGSGGGGAGNSNGTSGAGGSDGTDGTKGTHPIAEPTQPGIGQHTTTREFGEADGVLYSGGGGGYGQKSSANGGAGGGGNGGNDATAYGGGGGGRGSGYQGICIIRNRRTA
ncbi:glycine-rich domain-containing protein [Anaerotruncus massiliensis (ex Liu et al. 2021)]|uniref:glycine-rich domain-containing protein n=1 Tax=Anaerotruncus massiliensis (ex Liu et al. 2021) TaxID=2321404 RepID=UPI003AF88E76